MKMRRAGYLMRLLLGMTVLIHSAGWAQSKPESKAPVITNAYAVDTGRYGAVWRFYVEALDADADMDYVVVVADQPGVGRYPTDSIPLDPQHRNHLKGFLQWNTFSSRGAGLPEWTQITLQVSIIDKARNRSNEVVFPITFASGAKVQDEVPAAFERGNVPRLGFISIDLIRPNSN
jgi:hypothetical protein